ncbi:Crossover junction endonuclease mus81 [Nowakowskiella sp. JEL0078]|nr:Crossover junction endonuclease mus81 [Nowakowskiella sp. JEL0078]
MKPKIPETNSLFVKWLEEWAEEARNKSTGDSRAQKMQWVYKKAAIALSKYPLPLSTGLGCTIVQGIGPTLAKRLDLKLEEHNITGCISTNSVILQKNDDSSRSNSSTQLEPITTKVNQKSRSKLPYIPAFKSGAYAILLALLNCADPMTKIEIITSAQSYCDTSFEFSDAGKQSYTAWSSMSNLVNRDLVCSKGRPARYELTDDGIILARQLQEVSKNKDVLNNSVSTSKDLPTISVSHHAQSPRELAFTSSSPSGSSSSGSNSELYLTFSQTDNLGSIQNQPVQSQTITITPSEFDIVLILDSRETRGRSSQITLQDCLFRKGVKCDTKSLELGDVCWIASKKTGGLDIMLDIIVERKTMEDLVSSVKDGRMKEQKFRLINCGISTIIYLVEENDLTEAHQFGMQTIQTIMTSTQILEDIFLKQTANVDESVNYLVEVTNMLKRIYLNRNIELLRPTVADFEIFRSQRSYLNPEGKSGPIRKQHILLSEFSQFNTKKKGFTQKDIWIRQLITIRGMSGEKATTVVGKYPTMQR